MAFLMKGIGSQPNSLRQITIPFGTNSISRALKHALEHPTLIIPVHGAVPGRFWQIGDLAGHEGVFTAF